MDPLISVIVPVYNRERFVGSCLESIRRQTLREMEIICIDDGSNDSSKSIIHQHALEDDRIILISRENQGYGRTMNEGLQLARGRYIGIVEPDDLIDHAMYESLVREGEARDADVVKARYRTFGSTPAVTNNHASRSGWIVPSEELLFEHPCIWTGIYRNSFLKSEGITFIDTPGASFQDNPFWFEVLAASPRMWFIDEPFYHYRSHPTQSSSLEGFISNYSTSCIALARRLEERYTQRSDIDDLRALNLRRAIDYYAGLFKVIPRHFRRALFNDHVRCVRAVSPSKSVIAQLHQHERALYNAASRGDLNAYRTRIRRGILSHRLAITLTGFHVRLDQLIAKFKERV